MEKCANVSKNSQNQFPGLYKGQTRKSTNHLLLNHHECYRAEEQKGGGDAGCVLHGGAGGRGGQPPLPGRGEDTPLHPRQGGRRATHRARSHGQGKAD